MSNSVIEGLPVSSTLKTLLTHSKKSGLGDSITWKVVADERSPFFFDNMSMVDVVSIVINAFEEALMEPRFKIKINGAARDLVLSPITGPLGVRIPDSTAGTSSISIDEWYNAILRHIYSELRLSTVVW